MEQGAVALAWKLVLFQVPFFWLLVSLLAAIVPWAFAALQLPKKAWSVA